MPFIRSRVNTQRIIKTSRMQYLSVKTISEGEWLRQKPFHNHLLKRLKYLMRLSPQSGQIWGFLPSSSTTCNIYKPLKRINLGGSGWAAPPITSTRPLGYVKVDLMDLCDAQWSITPLWDKTLAGVESLLSYPEKGRGLGLSWRQHFSQTLLGYSNPFAEATTTSFYSRSCEGQGLRLYRVPWSKSLIVLYCMPL